QTEINVMTRQELKLAEFSGAWPAHIERFQIAALDDLQEGQKLAAEHVGPPAVIGERRHRCDRIAVAEKSAEIGLKSPERRQHSRGNAEFLPDTLEGAGIGLDLRLARLETI